jgi:hypothetical protein
VTSTLEDPATLPVTKPRSLSLIRSQEADNSEIERFLKAALVVSFEPDVIIVRNPDIVATEMDGDLVMMSIDRGEYFGISGVGSRVWELLGSPASVAEIVSHLTLEYDVEEDRCRAEVLDFVRSLFDRNLVVRA